MKVNEIEALTAQLREVVSKFRAVREQTAEYWKEWLNVKEPIGFTDWMQEAHPNAHPLALERDRLYVLCTELGKQASKLTSPKLYEFERVMKANNITITREVDEDGRPSQASFVKWADENYPGFGKLRTAELKARFIRMDHEKDDTKASEAKLILFPGTLAWKNVQKENEYPELEELYNEGKPFSRETAIRKLYGGIPNSWSPGHEQSLPLYLQDWQKFPYKIEPTEEDYEVFATDPEEAERLVWLNRQINTDYYDDDGEFIDPWEKYTPHEFVTQDIPDGCWWV